MVDIALLIQTTKLCSRKENDFVKHQLIGDYPIDNLIMSALVVWHSKYSTYQVEIDDSLKAEQKEARLSLVKTLA